VSPAQRQGTAGSNRARRQAAQAQARRRRHLGLGLSSAVVLALIGVLVGLHVSSTSPATALPQVGQEAPNGTFQTLSGRTETVASLRGRPTLLWFVTTWCSSCQAGTQTMAANLPRLATLDVRVVEVENAADLGQSGPSMHRFAMVLAGSASTNPDWTFGTASAALTKAYNPKGYLDIYYLLNQKGQITYINSSPASTMSALLAAAQNLT
jgi:thiol-disulfide isomerase/thioredoxin